MWVIYLVKLRPVEAVPIYAPISMYMRVSACTALPTQDVIKVSFHLFQPVGWKVVSNIHRKTCTRRYMVVLPILVKTLVSLKKAVKATLLQEGHLPQCPPQGVGWRAMDILVHWSQKGSQRLANKEDHSKSRSRESWVRQPRDSPLCEAECALYSSAAGPVTSGGLVSASCFQSPLCWEVCTHGSSSFLIAVYWVSSAGWTK